MPVATQQGFYFHHAERDYVMLAQWLPDTEDKLPANASHQVRLQAAQLSAPGYSNPCSAFCMRVLSPQLCAVLHCRSASEPLYLTGRGKRSSWSRWRLFFMRVSTPDPANSSGLSMRNVPTSKHLKLWCDIAEQEKNGPLRGKGVWKMPTGLSMAREDIADAAQREVQLRSDSNLCHFAIGGVV